MTQDMAPILKPALLGSRDQGIATGRGNLLNPSEEMTGDRLSLTGPSPRSQGVDQT